MPSLLGHLDPLMEMNGSTYTSPGRPEDVRRPIWQPCAALPITVTICRSSSTAGVLKPICHPCAARPITAIICRSSSTAGRSSARLSPLRRAASHGEDLSFELDRRTSAGHSGSPAPRCQSRRGSAIPARPEDVRRPFWQPCAAQPIAIRIRRSSSTAGRLGAPGRS